jgi:hypothetical protein
MEGKIIVGWIVIVSVFGIFSIIWDMAFPEYDFGEKLDSLPKIKQQSLSQLYSDDYDEVENFFQD